jgi:hypothetical protein
VELRGGIHACNTRSLREACKLRPAKFKCQTSIYGWLGPTVGWDTSVSGWGRGLR